MQQAGEQEITRPTGGAPSRGGARRVSHANQWTRRRSSPDGFFTFGRNSRSGSRTLERLVKLDCALQKRRSFRRADRRTAGEEIRKKLLTFEGSSGRETKITGLTQLHRFVLITRNKFNASRASARRFDVEIRRRAKLDCFIEQQWAELSASRPID